MQKIINIKLKIHILINEIIKKIKSLKYNFLYKILIKDIKGVFYYV